MAASWGSETGTILQGQYALVDKLGDRAGDTYRVQRRRDGRTLAIRMWHADSAAAATAFVDIARAATRVRHPTLASVEACGREPDDTCFLVSEFVEGQALDVWADKVGIPPLPLVIDLMRRLCLGLQAALRAGLSHDALNPNNVRVLSYGEGPAQRIDVKLLDLGVPSFVREAVPRARSAQFMAPEQLASLLSAHSHVRRGADPKMNVYSMGCLLYYLCTGGAPLQSSSVDDLREAHAQGKLVPPSRINPQIPVQLDAVIMRALAILPRDRHADVTELGEALGAIDLSSAASGVRQVVMVSMPPLPTVAAGVFADKKALDATPQSIVTRMPRARGATPIMDPSELIKLMKGVEPERHREPTEDELVLLIDAPDVAPAAAPRAQDSLRARSMPPRLSLAPRNSVAPRTENKRAWMFIACAAVSLLIGVRSWFLVDDALSHASVPSQVSSVSEARSLPPTTPASAVGDTNAQRAVAAPVENPVTPQVAAAPATVLPAVEVASIGDARAPRTRVKSGVRPQPQPSTLRVTPLLVHELGPADSTLKIVPKPQPVATNDAEVQAPRAQLQAQIPQEVAPEPQPQPPTAAASETAHVHFATSAPKPALPLRARVSISDVEARGSLPSALVKRALDRLRPQLSECYAHAAAGIGKNGFGTSRVEVSIDETARARDASSVGSALPGLDRCIVGTVNRVVSQRAPDTGTVKVNFRVVFEP